MCTKTTKLLSPSSSSSVTQTKQSKEGGRAMALEACFQLTPAISTVTRTPARTRALHAQNSRNIKLLPIKEPNKALSPFIQTSRPHSLICHATNAVDEVLEVSDNSWKELVVESKVPLVVVDFWAPSCGPCKIVAPVMDELAKDYAGKIACYKINTDDNLKMASQHGIRSIPTILFFKKGELMEGITGAVKKNALCAVIDKYLEA
ncbi:uncharacterized protein M6B38_331215 [Iris pallida]|uniref:Thioredoxin domain-containing protein n=1 Tax=Iris pallida TaxID=29817 RepID=A0AAX6H4M0_IRIPA|nr:uncharacterized protein M6B38_331215 [Iris pallida]